MKIFLNVHRGACVRRRGAPVPWHNGQSKSAIVVVVVVVAAAAAVK